MDEKALSAWSRGRLISPSLPVGDDRYPNFSSQKRSPGQNVEEPRSVRRSCTASRGTVVLVLSLHMRSIVRTEVLSKCMGKKYPRMVLLVPVSFAFMRSFETGSWK